MKKLLLLVIPLLLLVGCSSSGGSTPAATPVSYDRIKYVEVYCEGDPNQLSKEYRGERALKYCSVKKGIFTLTIETPSGSVYQIEVPASDLSSMLGYRLHELTNLPKIGDPWPPSE